MLLRCHCLWSLYRYAATRPLGVWLVGWCCSGEAGEGGEAREAREGNADMYVAMAMAAGVGVGVSVSVSVSVSLLCGSVVLWFCGSMALLLHLECCTEFGRLRCLL